MTATGLAACCARVDRTIARAGSRTYWRSLGPDNSTHSGFVVTDTSDSTGSGIRFRKQGDSAGTHSIEEPSGAC